jgi:hypothetical protein
MKTETLIRQRCIDDWCVQRNKATEKILVGLSMRAGPVKNIYDPLGRVSSRKMTSFSTKRDIWNVQMPQYWYIYIYIYILMYLFSILFHIPSCLTFETLRINACYICPPMIVLSCTHRPTLSPYYPSCLVKLLHCCSSCESVTIIFSSLSHQIRTLTTRYRYNSYYMDIW